MYFCILRDCLENVCLEKTLNDYDLVLLQSFISGLVGEDST